MKLAIPQFIVCISFVLQLAIVASPSGTSSYLLSLQYFSSVQAITSSLMLIHYIFLPIVYTKSL